MLSRAVLLLLAAFWLLMNGLLWRAEYGPARDRQNRIPLKLVWQKILTSPDSSSLNVIRHGRRIGYCSWSTRVGEEWAGMTEQNIPAGAPGKIRSYGIQVEGAAIVAEWTNRIRFQASLKVGPDYGWQDFKGHLTLRPFAWRIHAAAGEQTVELAVDEGQVRFERSFPFSELRNPGALLGRLFGPLAGEWMAGIAWPTPRKAGQNGPGLTWRAYEDTTRIGGSKVRVYRLESRWLRRYRISILVSRVGEILRVRLPGELVLVNDQLVAR